MQELKWAGQLNEKCRINNIKRKSVYAGLSFEAGLLYASVADTDKDYILMAAMLLSGIYLYSAAKFDFGRIFLIISVFALGFIDFRLYESNVFEKIISYSEQEIVYYGKVTDISEYSQGKSVYILNGEINKDVKAKLMVYTDTLSCEYGDYIYLIAQVKAFENTYLFDSADYYKSKEIFLQTESIKEISVTENKDFSLIKSIYGYVSDLKSYIAINTGSGGKFLTAMLFGDKSELDTSDKAAVYRVGIGHIMAVSGLHISILASAIIYLAGKCRYNRIIYLVTILPFLTVFLIIIQFSLSAVRAFIMTLITYGGVISGRKTDILNSLCISALLLTVTEPFTIMNPAFLLSVGGVYGVGVLAPYLSKNIKPHRKILKNMILCVSSSLTLFPVMVIYFDEISLISPISNVILIPMCMVAVCCGMIVIFTPQYSILSAAALKTAEYICCVVEYISEKLCCLPFTHLSSDYDFFRYVPALLAVMVIMVRLVTDRRKAVLNALGMSVTVIIAGCVIQNISERNVLKIAVFQSRYVSAVVVEKNGLADIIDFKGNTRSAKYVSEYISKNGINTINTLFIAENQYSALSAYKESLTLTEIKNIVLPWDTVLTKDKTVYEKIPMFANTENFSIDYSEYSIVILDNTVSIYHNEELVLQCSGNYSKTENIVFIESDGRDIIYSGG